MKSKVVVFGGSGFLGSHVADALTAGGYEVTLFDIFPSEHLQPTQKMIVGDILDKEAVERAINGATFVYNFAGLADIDEAIKNPENAIRLNILGNQYLLEAAKKNGIKRYIYASTVYVYGESGSFYRASKQAAETFVELYSEEYKLPFTILRYGSLYGRRADAKNAIHSFIQTALEKGEMTYEGSCEELREYIHVEDAAKASLKILEPEFENSHIVLTGHQAMRVKDVLKMISEIFESRVSVQFSNNRFTGHYSITPYTYKPRLGRKFVVNPFVDMGQGILDCIHEQTDAPHLIKLNQTENVQSDKFNL